MFNDLFIYFGHLGAAQQALNKHDMQYYHFLRCYGRYVHDQWLIYTSSSYGAAQVFIQDQITVYPIN